MTDSNSSSPASAHSGGQSGSEDPADHQSIGEVLTLLQTDFPDVSISKIRFLESRGLVEPHRAPSGYRKFGQADVERLRWILSMQRDHFLPLRVIKERLDQGGDLDLSPEYGAEAPPMAAVPRPKTSRFRDPNPGGSAGGNDLDPIELGRLSGLTAPQLDQLVRFGLLEPHDDGDGPRYTRSELKVAKAAAGFIKHGIEPRHLKAWRVAAEREAGMLEQIVMPVTRKGSAESTRRAREVADDLVDMGNVIRETIIVKLLRDRLGLGSD